MLSIKYKQNWYAIGPTNQEIKKTQTNKIEMKGDVTTDIKEIKRTWGITAEIKTTWGISNRHRNLEEMTIYQN